MPDPLERFSAVAEAYHRYRPGYPAELVDWIASVSGVRAGARVADLGCGTGIFSRLLASRELAVTGVEPNDAMLAHARATGGGPVYLTGDAAHTGLADASVDLVTAAQAFHWFPLAAALAEIDRILAPGGWACAVWNERRPSGFNDEYEALLHRWSREYAENPSLDELHSEPRRSLIDAAIPGAVTTDLPSGDQIDWETVLGRVRSASYVRHGIGDLPGFERDVREAFGRHAGPDQRLFWRMSAVAIAWPRRAG